MIDATTSSDAMYSRDIDDVMRDRERLAAENELLRHERDDLRRLLGMSPQLHDAHRVSLNGSLLEDSSDDFMGMDFRSSPERKVALFRSLFRGRDDVFAQRWANTRTGKSGYSPAVQRNWKSSSNGHNFNPLLPLTDSVIQQHLRGGLVAGVFPMLPDGTCWFVACDFDGETWVLDSLAYLQACTHASVPAALERSRSGNGGHVWTFFSEPVLAVTARRLAMQLLRAAMDKRCEIDLASYDRLFPSQDHVPKGGYGNLIAFPLQSAARRNSNSEFLDPSTLMPWADQWAFLAQVRKLSSTAVDELIEYLPPIGVGPDALRPNTLKHRNDPPPEHVTCTLGARLSIERSGLPSSLVTALKHAAMLHNPEWHQRRQLRLSTHDVPRFVRCYSEDLTHLHLPRGLLDSVSDLIVQTGSKPKLIDARATPTLSESLSFQVELSEGQQRAVDDALNHEFGVLVAPPGAGKTRMACRVIAERNTPTLVLAHTRPLLDQWRAALVDTLGITSKQIGQQGGGRKRRTHIVDLAMLQSLSRIENLEEFFSGYGMIIVDECHHIPAVSFENVIGHANARYVLGLTATPIRRDGLHDIITMQCGPIRHHMPPKQAIRDGDQLPNLFLHKRTTALTCADHEQDRPIHEQFAILVDDYERTRFICDDIEAAVKRGRRCIVLSQWRRHCVSITQDLIERGLTPILLHGELGKKERTRLIQQLEATTIDEYLVLVATSQLLGEGFDCPQLDTLFLTFPISFKGRIIQYVGRLMRAHTGKHMVEVYDYIDKAVPVLSAMAAKRNKTYTALGFASSAR